MCDSSQRLVKGWNVNAIGQGQRRYIIQQPLADNGAVWVLEDPTSKFSIRHLVRLRTLQHEIVYNTSKLLNVKDTITQQNQVDKMYPKI